MNKITHLTFENRPSIQATDNKPIERFEKSGELSLVGWFRQGNLEFNGKYVTEIEYEKTIKKVNNTTKGNDE